MIAISKANILPEKANLILIGKKSSDFEKFGLENMELDFVEKSIKNKEKLIEINRYDHWIYIQIIEHDKEDYKTLELARKAAHGLLSKLNKNKVESVFLVDIEGNHNLVVAFAEGLALANYQFLKYFKDKKDKINSLKKVGIFSNGLSAKTLTPLKAVIEGVFLARDLVNEPLSYLTAVQLAEEIVTAGKEAGFSVEVFEKKKIESLKMGALLAVNRGSVDPPTFTVVTWNPKNATNKKPIVLVGKGIVFDTGGLSLKPTSGSMDSMKSDMAGAAAVVGGMYAIAKAGLPVHVVGLVPATDNRPGGNAYAPQDIVKMHNGMTVEVLNTDAEGRMILADSLSFAKQYNPELVIDLATLTGAAVVAVGTIAIAGMGTAGRRTFDKLKKSGNNVYERIVELPSWDEYNDDLKSYIADLKNVGGKWGGAITAGKFLQHFTDYPWIHLDIAGPAWLDGADSYRPKGGTGVGVRLLFDFIESI